MDKCHKGDHKAIENNNKVIDELQKLNATLQAELDKHRWIPVTEKLPKESGYYQVVRKINRYPSTREYCAKSLMWISQDTVTHWKPIVLPVQNETV